MKYYEERIFNYVKEIMVELSFDVLQKDDIKAEKLFREYNFDHVQLIDIILSLEDKLQMKFTNSCVDIIYLNGSIYDFVKILTEEYVQNLYVKIELENMKC